MTNVDLFKKGLDLKKFEMAQLKDNYRDEIINLFYAGRISKDKNLEYEAFSKKTCSTNL